MHRNQPWNAGGVGPEHPEALSAERTHLFQNSGELPPEIRILRCSGTSHTQEAKLWNFILCFHFWFGFVFWGGQAVKICWSHVASSSWGFCSGWPNIWQREKKWELRGKKKGGKTCPLLWSLGFLAASITWWETGGGEGGKIGIKKKNKKSCAELDFISRWFFKQ